VIAGFFAFWPAQKREGGRWVVNYRRGLKRSYVVLSAVWIAYWLAALPLRKERRDDEALRARIEVCASEPDAASMRRCIDEAKQPFLSDTGARFFSDAYLSEVWLLLAPVILYPLLLGGMGAVSWVRRGFREGP